MDIFVSDKISDIKFLNPDMTFSLNIKMAEHYLSGNRIATQESLITGIYKVNNGEFIKFNNQLKPVLLRDEFSITKKNNSTIDSIIDNIEMMRDNRKIALLFSGGLDSALIFHTLKESGNKFCAYHFFLMNLMTVKSILLRNTVQNMELILYLLIKTSTLMKNFISI
ncbi:hypothetical protein AAS61_004922 [Escherichia coli]|nr:hypothetical protein [Escherichia coli]HCQ3970245.1 hypothetical protein [Escherichia coli]